MAECKLCMQKAPVPICGISTFQRILAADWNWGFLHGAFCLSQPQLYYSVGLAKTVSPRLGVQIVWTHGWGPFTSSNASYPSLYMRAQNHQTENQGKGWQTSDSPILMETPTHYRWHHTICTSPALWAICVCRKQGQPQDLQPPQESPGPSHAGPLTW